MKGMPGPSRSRSGPPPPTSAARAASGSGAAPAAGSAGLRLAASSKRRALEPGQLELGLVGLAERHDPRQELRPAVAAFGEQRDERPGGAARRQIDRGVGERRGIVGKPATRRPSSSASTSVGRKGQPGGMEKTCGRSAAISLTARLRRGTPRRRRSPAVANMQPLPVEAQAEEPLRRDRAVVEEVGRERPVRRVVQKFRLHDRDARIDEGRDLALARGGAGGRSDPCEIAAALVADARGAGATSIRMSMRSGSHASMRRGRLGRGPSIQSESELRVRNGSSPSSGSAFLRPPPVSSSALALVRDHDRAAPAGAQVRFDQVGEVMDVDDRRSRCRPPRAGRGRSRSGLGRRP